MNAARVCPECGKPLPGDGPQGLCPECLLKAALPGESVLSAATGLYGASPAMAIAPEAGLRIKYFGDYELLEEIARGGMGVVWKARQASLNRAVALKMIRAGALASGAEIERFRREAEAAANLQHPNIVAIHEVGTHDGQQYFSMDFVAGRDLGSLVQDGPLPPQRAARYVKIIAEAIHFAHQRGTLHRDLKPQNVLIDSADQPRITDFGLAKLMSDDSRLTQSGVIMGSPSYMPPEQAAGRHADIGPASDVYSLGAMLYELLTGRPPFRGTTPLSTLRDVLEAEPPSPRRINPDVPRDLETICLKCLEKMPSARYASARALAEELERYLKGEPIQARPASTMRKAVSWARRHPGTLAALAALVVVALTLGLFYLFEENALLRAQQLDPTFTRSPGRRHELREMWHDINSFVIVGGLFLFLVVQSSARRVSFKAWFDPDQVQRLRPTQPLGQRTRTLVLCSAPLMLGSGVALIVTTIRAHVWEGDSIAAELFPIYASTYFGLAFIGLLIRDYRLTEYGAPSRSLTTEQIEPIRRAMEDYDLLAAVKSYRAAVPEASLAEASDYAIRLAESLRGQHPGKFVPRRLTLTDLNWTRMALALAIGVVLLGLWWALLPPAEPAPFLWNVAASFLLGAGMMAGARVKGFWRRMLLLVPAIVAMTLAETIAPWAGPRDMMPFYFGIMFGVATMTSGYTRCRPTVARP